MENRKFQLKLKILWFKNFLGLSVDQVSLNYEYSLTPYYFWPKTEAWEQLKLELDSKPWLSQEEKINILRTAAEIMKYWLSYRNTKTIKNLKEEFKNLEFLIINN